MAPYVISFAVVLAVLTLVSYRQFGKNVGRWLWQQKLVFALLGAAGLTLVELFGLKAILAPIPLLVQMASQLLFAILFMVVQFGAMMWIMSRPRVTWYQPGELNLTLDDYVGNHVVKQMLEETITNIKSDTKFAKMGGKPSRGILMSGPPGTGKSYGGRVVASVCGVPFCLVDAASLQSAFMGMGSMTVNSLYAKARKYARQYGACIIFLDELDAIGGSRTGQGGGMGMLGGMMMGGGSQLLNTLLTNLDPPPADGNWFTKLRRKLGFPTAPADNPYVLTMGATNLPDRLDSALVRDGRMDLTITVDLPDVNSRAQLFAYELKKVKVAKELDPFLLSNPDTEESKLVAANIRALALQTGGWSPASIKTIVSNKAVQEATRAAHEAVTFADVVKARRTKSFGVKQPLLAMPYNEKRRIAYHEAGHAFMAMGRRPEIIVEYATIIRRSNALGLVAYGYADEHHTITKKELLAEIDVCLASRAVEIELLDEEMSGFSGDLGHATSVAAHMISMYGMDDELVSIAALGAAAVPAAKVNRINQKRMAICRALVAKHRDLVVEIAETLLLKEEMDGDELKAIFLKFLPSGVLDCDAVAAEAKVIESAYYEGAKQNAAVVGADAIIAGGAEGKKHFSSDAVINNSSVQMNHF